MKVILILAALAAVAVARPEAPLARGVVPILDYQLTRDEFGQYALSYTSGDGTVVSEQGALVPNDGGTDLVLVKQGSFKYYAPDGSVVEETWTADKTGFHPTSDSIPTTPKSV